MVATDFQNLDHGHKVDALVAVLDYQTEIDKNDAPYLQFQLSDCHCIKKIARQWDVPDSEAERVKDILWARVRGTAKRYKGIVQIRLEAPIQAEAEPFNANSYIPASQTSLAELLQRLDNYIHSVQHPSLHALLRCVFLDDKQIRARFALMPAALERHHAFRHGLLQHTLEVADAVDAVATKQQTWTGRGRLSRDLAVTGALLHDIGKLEEFETYRHGVRYSTSGNLLGHVNQGMIRIARKIAALRKTTPFSPELEQHILHFITSHHGKPEYGSPCPPKTSEAALIHNADLLTVELFYFAEATTSADLDTSFVYQRKLDSGFGGQGRQVFTGQIQGLWEPIPSMPISDTPSLPATFPIPLPPMPKTPSLPVLRAGTGLLDEARFPTIRLPLLGQIAAGKPIDSTNAEEDIAIESVVMGVTAKSSFLLRVIGDSMIGDGIEDNDLIVVRKQSHADFGDVIVAQLEDGATVKRLAYQNGAIQLMPSNPTHEPIIVPNSDALRIQGRVVAIVRS